MPNNKSKTIVVLFLLLIVVVSSFVLLKLYKAESAKTGTTKTIVY